MLFFFLVVRVPYYTGDLQGDPSLENDPCYLYSRLRLLRGFKVT